MKVHPRLYDLFMAPFEALGLRAARRRLMDGLTGRVVEIGSGTGLNLAAAGGGSGPAIAIERDLQALMVARRRAPGAALVCADAQALPFRDGTFDAALETLVLCSVDHPARVVSEVRRVLKPGGELRMLDHVRAPGRALSWLQDLLAPAWLRLTGECRLNRELGAALRESGLTVERHVERARGTIQIVTARA